MDICCHDEKWVYVKGFEPFYMVSSCGRFKTCKAKGGSSNGKHGGRIDIIGDWKNLKQYLSKLRRGHRKFSIYLRKNGKRYIFNAHRVIYESFVGIIPDKYQIDHIDRNYLNNHLSNLRLATPAQQLINCNNLNSGIKFDKRSLHKPWKVSIGINKVKLELGSYSNFEDAYKVRKEAEIKYYGEFSNKLN